MMNQRDCQYPIDRSANHYLDTEAINEAGVELGGDGSSWVKEGIELFPNTVYHLDRWSREKKTQLKMIQMSLLSVKKLSAAKDRTRKQLL